MVSRALSVKRTHDYSHPLSPTPSRRPSNDGDETIFATGRLVRKSPLQKKESTVQEKAAPENQRSDDGASVGGTSVRDQILHLFKRMVKTLSHIGVKRSTN